MEWEKLIFNSTYSKFFNSNFTKFNDTTPTLAHVKKGSNFTLKYVAPETLTQQYTYNQGCEVGVFSLDLMKLKSRVGVGFFDLVELEIEVLIAFGDFD